AQSLQAPTTHQYDYLHSYVGDLDSVVDMASICDAKITLGVDPLGGAGIDYWPVIAEKYGLNLTVVNKTVDPTFRFMTVDWDGKIRTDPSSPYAMQRLIGMKDKFDIAFAADADHDRHGIVTKGTGLLPPNHYLSVCIHYLFANRDKWAKDVAVGKTVVSSGMIDRVAARLGRRLFEVPVGFKWFVEGLLAAEITARSGKDPGEIYRELTRELGDPVYERIEASATLEQKAALARLSAADLHVAELAGDKVQQILTTAPGDGNAIGGIKVIAKNGWFAARPSGTEEIYKIYAESFLGQEHLRRIEEEAQTIVSDILARSVRAAAHS